jgi:hypothetical protein
LQIFFGKKENWLFVLIGFLLTSAPNSAQAKPREFENIWPAGNSALTPRPLPLGIDDAAGIIVVSDRVSQQLGHDKISGNITQRVKNDQLSSWRLEDFAVDINSQDKQAYLSNILYIGRLNERSDGLKIGGDFPSINNSGNDKGFNMLGKELCL